MYCGHGYKDFKYSIYVECTKYVIPRKASSSGQCFYNVYLWKEMGAPELNKKQRNIQLLSL